VLGLIRNSWQTVLRTDPSTASTGWPAFSLLIRVAVILSVLLLVVLSAFQFFLAFGSFALLREKDRAAHRNHAARKRARNESDSLPAFLRRWFYTLVWGEWVFPVSGLALLLPLSFPLAFRMISRRTLLQQVSVGYVFLNPCWILLLLWGIVQILSFLWRTYEKELRWTLFDRPTHAAAATPSDEDDDPEEEPIYVPEASGKEVNHERAAQNDRSENGEYWGEYHFDWKKGAYEAETVQVQKVRQGEDRSEGRNAAGDPEGPQGSQDAVRSPGDGRNAAGNEGAEEGRQGGSQAP
jgi:hypothetical protein